MRSLRTRRRVSAGHRDRGTVAQEDRDAVERPDGRPGAGAKGHAQQAGLHRRAEPGPGVDPHDRRAGDLELAINELGANSIVHAGGKGVLRIWPEDGHVLGEVRDDGRFTDPLAGRLPAGLSTDGGRGLLMVNHLADLVRLHTTPEGTAIRVYMRL